MSTQMFLIVVLECLTRSFCNAQLQLKKSWNWRIILVLATIWQILNVEGHTMTGNGSYVNFLDFPIKKLVKTLWVKVIFCLPICSYLLCWDAWHVPFATHTLNYKTPHSHRIKATNSHANELNTHTVQNFMLIRFKSRKEFT